MDWERGGRRGGSNGEGEGRRGEGRTEKTKGFQSLQLSSYQYSQISRLHMAIVGILNFFSYKSTCKTILWGAPIETLTGRQWQILNKILESQTKTDSSITLVLNLLCSFPQLHCFPIQLWPLHNQRPHYTCVTKLHKFLWLHPLTE